MSALAQKQTFPPQKAPLRFPPKSGHLQRDNRCPLMGQKRTSVQYHHKLGRGSFIAGFVEPLPPSIPPFPLLTRNSSADAAPPLRVVKEQSPALPTYIRQRFPYKKDRAETGSPSLPRISANYNRGVRR